MNNYIILIILISISAAFAYINNKFIKMPFVIGLFFLSTILSLMVIFNKFFLTQPYSFLKNFVDHTDISKFIINIMLGFLLFAGSLHTDWIHIKKQLKQITVYAVGGVILSTALIAVLFYSLSFFFKLNIDFIYCLLFGALISPTDPIAVLGILTKANVPPKIENTIVGESLFNDGIGVVIFITLLEVLNSGSNNINFSHFGILFFREAIGGGIFGLISGFILFKLLKSIDHYETEVLLTVAFVMMVYGISLELHVSGPLSMVIMGLFIGNYKENLAMSIRTKDYVYKFWELVDVILNAILFILMGMVIIVIDFKMQYIFIGIFSVLLVLFSRIIVVFLPKIFLPRTMNYTNKEAKLLVWGGLRGGLSIALVLSLPNSEAKNILLIATYFCVVFSILVQGLTIKKMAMVVN